MMFIGCTTASPNNMGLPDAAGAAGADCAIGFFDSIYADSANAFTNNFFSNLVNGRDITEAAQEATLLCNDPKLSDMDVVFK